VRGKARNPERGRGDGHRRWVKRKEVARERLRSLTLEVETKYSRWKEVGQEKWGSLLRDRKILWRSGKEEEKQKMCSLG